MAETARLPHDPERPLREVTAYLHGELAPEAKAAFEAHLSGCADCQESLSVGRLVFPAFDALLAADRRPRTAVDAMALLDAAQAELDAEARAEAAQKRAWPARRAWAPRLPWLATAAAGAMAAAAALLLFLRTPGAELVEPVATKLVARLELAAPFANPAPPWRPELQARVTLEKGKLEISSPREAGDRYVAVALADRDGRLWIVRRGQNPDPTCKPGCGALSLRVDASKLPPGGVRVLLAVSPEPVSPADLERWISVDAWKHPGRPLPTSRAEANEEVAP